LQIILQNIVVWISAIISSEKDNNKSRKRTAFAVVLEGHLLRDEDEIEVTNYGNKLS